MKLPTDRHTACLWNPAHREPKQLARRSHPETSKAAAAEVAEVLGERQRFALDAVRRMPDATSLELDMAFAPGERGRVQKRLNELERAGLIERSGARRCSISGKTAATWRAKP